MAFADYDKILLFGDSITEQAYEQTRGFGFAAALADAYKRRLEVVGRGFSGYNTLHGLDVLPRVVPPPGSSRIVLTTVFLGTNDAVLSDRPQYVPLDQYSNNLRRIINHSALKAHDTRFILITPAPLCEYDTQARDAAMGKHYIQRLVANTKLYVDATLEVGKDLGVPTVNLWEAFMEYVGGWEEGKPFPGSKEIPKNEKFADLFRDGLHFMPKGYEIMYRLVRKAIKENYPDLDPEALEYIFPQWEVAPKAEP